MSVTDILFIVQYVTGVKFSEMKSGSHSRSVLWPKYLVIVMMHEEGFRHVKIAEFFGLERTNVYHNLKTIDALLCNHADFKIMYKRCIKCMAYMEDAA